MAWPRIGIGRCRETAKQRGGQCLSVEYINNNTKLHWRCSKGHEWNAVYGSVQQGCWCPECAGSWPASIEQCKQLALERGCQYLSRERVNDRTIMRWKCNSCGREWNAYLSNIKKGHGCPYCRTNNMENRCRIIFETIFGMAFPKCRPFKCLRESRLELDGYNNELSLAFEYDGIHHRTGKIFKHQETNPLIFEHDRKKDALCKQSNIRLIRINDLEATQKTLVDIIIKKLTENDITFPPPSNETHSKLRNPLDVVYKRLWGTEYLQKFREVCSSHTDPVTGQKGELLPTEVWLGCTEKYDIRCERNHLFKGTYDRIFNRHGWCPVCAGHLPVGIKKCIQWALTRNGRLDNL